jgi:lactoylglutathione lyase
LEWGWLIARPICIYNEVKGDNEMFQKVDYVMVMVSDMQKSVAFYRDQLGLPLKFESKDWSEFQTGETTLALHGGGSPKPPSQGPEPAGTCSIGFNVPDLNATYQQLKERGVRFVMPPSARAEEGIHLCVAVDPDGLPIAFAQPLNQ